MRPPYLRPLGKLVLRARGGHLALQLHNLPPQRGLSSRTLGRGGREAVVEGPELDDDAVRAFVSLVCVRDGVVYGDCS